MKQASKKMKEYKYDSKDWDDSKSVVVIREKKNSGISTSIRLPKEMVAKLRKVARKKGDIGYQTLLKIWIAERLEKETAQNDRSSARCQVLNGYAVRPPEFLTAPICYASDFHQAPIDSKFRPLAFVVA